MIALRNFIVCAAVVVIASTAQAQDKSKSSAVDGVGLGVAGGVSYSMSKIRSGEIEQNVGAGFAWGFFVDIPLLSTFYITPAAMLYSLNLDGTGQKPVTDVDLNFKFIVPINDLRLGVGLTGGLTNAQQRYSAHYGLLGYISYNLISNFDAFLLIQYKRLVRDGRDIDNLHGFFGGMFRF